MARSQCLVLSAYFQDIPSCPDAVSPEKSPFCGESGIALGRIQWGCSCPRLSSRSRLQSGGLGGCSVLYSPMEWGYSLLQSFYIPPNLKFSWTAGCRGAGGRGSCWVVWGKLWQLHPWIRLWTVPSARSIQKSPQKMMLWMRKMSAGNGCGHTLLTPHSGTLSSKNYPGTYPNHTMCCWRLQAPPGTSILLAFGDVDLEPSEHCAHSSLLLADPQTGTAYGPYCRNSVPSASLLVTNSSTVTVLFNSTSHRSGRGLLVSYATSQHPDLVSCLVRGTHYTQEHISVYCPAGCKDIHGDIWGNPSQGYRDTSVLCKAAVHAGVIADELGGQVTLSREKGITLYESAFANGLRSKRGSLSEKRLVFHKDCDDVLEVVTFNASSWWHEVDVLGQVRAWVAERAALSTTGHSWAAEPGAKAAWLELDLGTRRNVTGIITKGSSEQHNYYVMSYHVSSSRDGKNWRPYRGSSGQEDKVFEGNADSQGEVSNAFIPPIIARYIRVTPQSWHQRIALKVALMGCQLARVRIPRPYVPSVPKEVLEATRQPASRTPIPGITLDPEKAGSTLLVMLLIGSFVLLCSCLLLLAFLCYRKRKSAVELNCGITKGYPKLESSQVCSLQSLPAPSLASFPMTPTPGDLSWTHSPEYTEPDLVQVNPSSQTGPSTFKPLLEEGYTLPLVLNHYDVPGKHNEYAEPLPPEPEYAMPFSEPEPAGMHRSTCIITGPARCSPVQYQTPALRPGELPAAVEGTGSPYSEGSCGWPRHCPLAHVYHEAL
ncbi:discoidin, CUB and LCCL domain-containing protein 1-like isoform X3 [Serinus canaria]|nr:discoidin, CUB and LCCL domain-containing protein 1-like isoform X3 [Serinus canaria]XP_050839340.1 discoidin, CUB and LCCL domain-containing protein 1-like isoform X3 [Serinus canaria]